MQFKKKLEIEIEGLTSIVSSNAIRACSNFQFHSEVNDLILAEMRDKSSSECKQGRETEMMEEGD